MIGLNVAVLANSARSLSCLIYKALSILACFNFMNSYYLLMKSYNPYYERVRLDRLFLLGGSS